MKPTPRTAATAFTDATNNNAYGGSPMSKAAWKQYQQMRQSGYRDKIVEPDPDLQQQQAPQSNG